MPAKFPVPFLGFGHLQPFPDGRMGECSTTGPGWELPHEMDRSKEGTRAEKALE